MSDKTNIAWCDSTINFWSGCTKISPGCAHCYAESLSKRDMGNIGKWGKGAPRIFHDNAIKLAHRLNAKARICDNCGHAQQSDQGNPDISSTFCLGCLQHNVTFHARRIFSLSIGDIGDAEVPLVWFARAMVTIDKCRNVTWILCTKRCDEFLSRWLKVCQHWGRTDTRLPSNVIMLTSVENQAMADLRIPQLLRIPAAVRGLSLEPLLGPVDLNAVPRPAEFHIQLHGWGTWFAKRISWLIIGGESGHNARPCDLDWIRSLVSQGKAASTATFVKQLGASPSMGREDHQIIRDKKGSDMSEWPSDLRIQEFIKKIGD